MNHERARLIRLTLLACGLLSGLGNGCSLIPSVDVPWAGVARDASAGFYETAKLEYRLDAGRLGQPLDVVRIDGQQVAYEQIASSPVADQSTGTLTIKYPHPAGRAGMAQVIFALDSTHVDAKAKSWSPFGSDSGKSDKKSTSKNPIGTTHEEIHEVWALDLPHEQSDQFFKLVSTQNFYNGKAIEKGPVELAVTINGKEIRKTWEPIEGLNELVRRVRREGQLVAYLRPTNLAGQAPGPIVSTQSYRQMMAELGGPSAPASAFSLVPPRSNPANMARLPKVSR